MEQLQVKEERIKVLFVTVVKAEGVSTGSFFEVETPDPYVMLRVRTSPNSKQRTSTKGNDVNPVWNEKFKFYLNSEKKNTLELIMMDDDFGFDDTVGVARLELDDLPIGKSLTCRTKFNETTSLEIKLLIQMDTKKELRFSHELCNQERDFVKKRKEAILKNMSKVLPKDEVPRNVDEVPTIAIMGSGGGYRAACGLSGVFCALQETGIVDCATYVTGLSGSSWYISTLYSRDKGPFIKCDEFAQELKKRFQTHVSSHFHLNFKDKLIEKSKRGQPVRFTDVFGMAIGDALLTNTEAKLSQQSDKVKNGEIPLPICTGIRVAKNVSAESYSEWIEFSPYEFGMPKYGVYGNVSDFGGKFYKGHLVKEYEESPLHFLQGVWGSAFSILLSRVIGGDDKITTEEDAKKELEKEISGTVDKLKTEDDDSDDEETPEDEIQKENWLVQMLNPMNWLSSRAGKAAETFNICRGLKFVRGKDKECVDQPGKAKTMCVVDSGIAFNSPFPTLVREARQVDLILSFDFSARDGGDDEPPFKELLKAEEWARENNIPFPSIAAKKDVIEDPNIRECYVFDDPSNPRCPTILHFPIINKTFRDYLKPGVPRVTKEEKDFGNFRLFDDGTYSSFTFEYEGRSFDRLHQLMKYNTLAHMDVIKQNIAGQVKVLRNNPRTTS